MMHFQIPLLLSLATLAISAVVPRSSELAEMAEQGNILKIYKDAPCSNLHNISMNAGSLPPPSPGLRLYHVAIGRGTQVRSDLLSNV